LVDGWWTGRSRSATKRSGRREMIALAFAFGGATMAVSAVMVDIDRALRG
jgi:hypothetical protein